VHGKAFEGKFIQGRDGGWGKNEGASLPKKNWEGLSNEPHQEKAGWSGIELRIHQAENNKKAEAKNRRDSRDDRNIEFQGRRRKAIIRAE